jgi:hypothetical protein
MTPAFSRTLHKLMVSSSHFMAPSFAVLPLIPIANNPATHTNMSLNEGYCFALQEDAFQSHDDGDFDFGATPQDPIPANASIEVVNSMAGGFSGMC